MRKTRKTTACNCLAVLHIAISGAIGYTFVCKVTRSWGDGVLLNSYINSFNSQLQVKYLKSIGRSQSAHKAVSLA